MDFLNKMLYNVRDKRLELPYKRNKESRSVGREQAGKENVGIKIKKKLKVFFFVPINVLQEVSRRLTRRPRGRKESKNGNDADKPIQGGIQK